MYNFWVNEWRRLYVVHHSLLELNVDKFDSTAYVNLGIASCKVLQVRNRRSQSTVNERTDTTGYTSSLHMIWGKITISIVACHPKNQLLFKIRCEELPLNSRPWLSNYDPAYLPNAAKKRRCNAPSDNLPGTHRTQATNFRGKNGCPLTRVTT